VAGLLVLLGFTIGTVCVADAGPKKYYLTQGTFDASQARMACEDGYHMASLWEIFDTTNLKYDTSRGTTLSDSGSGPPAQFGGWIRTGGSFGTSTTPGVGNCNAYTTNLDSLHGTSVHLYSQWGDGATLVSPWRAVSDSCDELLPVWCVKD